MQLQQRVLGKQPQIHRHLIIARASGVQPRAQLWLPRGQPQLDGSVGIFVLTQDRQLASRHRLQCSTQRLLQPQIFIFRKQPRLPQTISMTQAAQHIPAQELPVPDGIISDGKIEDLAINGNRRGPQRGELCRRRCRGFFSAHDRYSCASFT